MFKRIVPSLYLDITDILMHGMYCVHSRCGYFVNICKWIGRGNGSPVCDRSNA